MCFFNNKKNIIITITIAIVVFISLLCILLFPTLYQYRCQTRVYKDIQEKIESSDIELSCIRICKYEESLDLGDTTRTSYSECGCGVVFQYDNGYFYALTAAHVIHHEISVDEFGFHYKNTYYAMQYYDKVYERYNGFDYVYLDDYIATLDKIEIEYISSEYDIAVIKFQSKKEFKCIEISDIDPTYQERVVAFGNPIREYPITYGKIISKELEVFESGDESPDNQVLNFNAYAIHGSSGGAVLNENLSLVGITIGGVTNYDDKYKRTVMVPVSIILNVIDEWMTKE